VRIEVVMKYEKEDWWRMRREAVVKDEDGEFGEG
jgi:hypothetical protein